MGENPRPGLRLVERLILVGVWLTSCAVVYGIGFYTGNRIQERVPAAEDRVVRLPVTAQPPPEGQRAKTGDEFTFYDSLVPGAHPDANDGKAKAPAPDAKTANAKVRPSKSGATASNAGPKQRVASGTNPGTGEKAKSGAKTASTSAVRAGARLGTKTGTKSGTATTARSGATASAKESGPKRTAYTVEASPTRSRSEAEAMRATLARRGFDATVQAVPKDGGTWYRLRVGRYASAEQAEQAMRQVRDRGGVSRAYVASQ